MVTRHLTFEIGRGTKVLCANGEKLIVPVLRPPLHTLPDDECDIEDLELRTETIQLHPVSPTLWLGYSPTLDILAVWRIVP